MKNFAIVIKKKCPVNDKCCLSNVIHQAKVSTSDNDNKIYIGSTKKSFKPSYYEHKATFPIPYRKPKNCTQLANHLWNLNNNNKHTRLNGK